MDYDEYNYVYYNGKIYKTETLEHHTLVKLLPHNLKHIYEEYCFDDGSRLSFLLDDGKAKLFNDFEDLIEVGDLVFASNLYDTTGPLIIKEMWIVDDRKWLRIWFDRITEIWKRINNTFVRVCHKENERWVID